MSGVIERLNEYVSHKRLSKRSFYKETGFSNGYLDKEKSVGSEKIETIISIYPDINLHWLLTGQGPMLSEGLGTKGDLAVKPSKGVPYFELNAEAGMPSPFGGVAVEAIQQPTQFYTISHEFGNDNVFITNVWGDSMSPKYESGDRIICKHIRELSFVQWGRTYLLDTDQGILVKNIEPYEKDLASYLCVSENKQYKPFRLHKEEIRNVALVMGVVRREG